MATKLPGIPSIVSVQDTNIAAILRPMKESIEILGSAVTSAPMASGQTAVSGIPGSSTTTTTDLDYTPPPAPTNVQAAGAFSNIIVSWNSPTYSNHAYAEVWRSSTDVRGNATLVGFAPGGVYSDAVSVSTTFYYWVRFVSNADVAGPFNALLGTLGATSPDPAFVLGSLNQQISEAHITSTLNTRLDKIEDLEETYGSTVSAAASAAAAATSAADAVTAKTAAILAQAGAETASATSSQAASDAVTAKVAAITAQSGAETAKDSAVSAKTDAQTAASNASTSATQASTSATNAANSASSASTSATTAANSATSAGNSASAAATSATNAATYATSSETASTASTNAKVAAESARDSAETSATAASTSATTATTKASDAAQSATAASTSATNAATSAGSASTSADQAATSATSAAGSASNAATSATTAANSATAAGNSATAAATSATNASTYATNAETASTAATSAKVSAESARDSAQTSATAASTSASTASTKATDAATSATAANTSATNAATSAGNAATSATNAATSETNSASSASSAATSATTAANSATAAGNSATSAATSASTASTKATDAAQYASSANTSATNASTSASDAATYATNASTSATNAAGSATSAANSLLGVQATIRGTSLGLPLEQWSLNGQSIVVLTDGKVGNNALRLLGSGGAYPNQGNFVPIDPTKKYRVKFWARPSSNAAGYLYFSLRQFISNDANAPGPVNGGRSPYKPSYTSRADHIAAYGDTWGEYNFLWTSADWQTGVKYVQPEFLDNYSGAAGYWDIQNFTFADVTDVETVSTNTSAAIQQRMIARAASDGSALAEYSVVTDVNGRLAGFGLGSEVTATGGAAASTFGIRADKFYIAPPTDFSQETQPSSATTGQLWYKPSTKVTYRYTGTTWVVFSSIAPFVVQTTTTTVNGVTVNPGVYMDAAYIVDGSITNAKIGLAAIDDAKIANLDATKITSGYINAARIEAGSIDADRLNVTSLSAITTNTGNLSVTGKFKANTAEVSGTSMTGTGGVINSDGTFAFGSSTTNVQFDGSTLNVNGLLNLANANSGVTSIGPSNGNYFGGPGTILTFTNVSTKPIQFFVSGSVELFSAASTNIYLMEGTLEVRLYNNADALIGLLQAIPYQQIASSVESIYGTTSKIARFIFNSYNQRITLAAGTYKIKIVTTNEKYRNSAGQLFISSVVADSSYGFEGYCAVYQAKI